MTVMTTWSRDLGCPGHVKAGHLGHVVVVAAVMGATCLARLGHLPAPALLVGHVLARPCLRVSISVSVLVTVVALQGMGVLIRGCLSYP